MPPRNSVRVLARLVVHPDKIEVAKKIFQNLADETRKEIGCIKYDLLQNVRDPTEFVFEEEWETQGNNFFRIPLKLFFEMCFLFRSS
jgi:quinol monooxygenase YgiN